MAVIAWEIPFEIIDTDEAAVARKVAAFMRWCRSRGSEASIVRRQDLGPGADSPVRALVVFELRSEQFRHPAFYHAWHRLFASPMKESRRALRSEPV